MFRELLPLDEYDSFVCSPLLFMQAIYDEPSPYEALGLELKKAEIDRPLARGMWRESTEYYFDEKRFLYSIMLSPVSRLNSRRNEAGSS